MHRSSTAHQCGSSLHEIPLLWAASL